MKKIIALFLAITFLFSGCNKGAVSTTTEESSLKTSSEVSSPKKELERHQGNILFLFDTITYVLGYTEDEARFLEILKEIETELEEYHQLYDIYNEYPGINNICTINKNAGIQPVKVDPRIIDLLDFSIEMYEETEGLTNIALGSVLKIWHDYRTAGMEEPKTGELPPMELLQAANEHTDISKLVINREESTVYLEDPEMSLDVGSIGKGYAVERVGQSLEERGIQHFMLSVGGNIRVVGTKPDGAPWDTGIENPYGGSDFMGVAQMYDGSLVTSGSYQRFYTVDGVRYHHIIHPETLMPEHYMTSVALLCEDSGKADALSTAVFNMPLEEGREWVENYPALEAMWMLEDETVIYSSGFPEHLREK